MTFDIAVGAAASDPVGMARIGLVFTMGMMLVCIETAAQSRATEVNLSAMKPGAPPRDFEFERTGQGRPDSGSS
jgi:hypothetical protein